MAKTAADAEPPRYAAAWPFTQSLPSLAKASVRRLRWIRHELRAECEIAIDSTLVVALAHTARTPGPHAALAHHHVTDDRR